MKMVIFALGSRGDVQPCVALGAGLLASADFREPVTSHGLEFIAIGGSHEALARELQQLVEQGRTLKVCSRQARRAEEQAHDATAHALAADLGARIRAEDGVARAVAVIERHGRQQGG